MWSSHVNLAPVFYTWPRHTCSNSLLKAMRTIKKPYVHATLYNAFRMTISKECDVVVVGGGIAGLAAAVGLRNAGIQSIQVFEKAQSLRPVGAAIGLFPNGLRALQEISPVVHKRVLESAILSQRSCTHDLSGKVVRESDLSVGGLAGSQITYLVWYLLQQYLSEELVNAAPDSLRLSTAVESFSQDSSGVTVRVVERGGAIGAVKCRLLVAADGIWSTVRTGLFGEAVHASKDDGNASDGSLGDCTQLLYHGKMMFRSVLPLDALDAGVCPPAGTSNSWAGDEEGKLFACRETAKGIVTVTAMAKFPDAADLRSTPEARKQRLKEVFKGYPETVHHIIDRTEAESIFENAVWDIDVLPEWSKGCVVLIGDAAHAMTPGLGQGANQGLEDSAELVYYVRDVILKGYETVGFEGLAGCLEAFWNSRRPRVVEVHAGSRERTAQVNKSTVQTRAGSKPVLGAEFRRTVYDWKPSALVGRETVHPAEQGAVREPVLA